MNRPGFRTMMSRRVSMLAILAGLVLLLALSAPTSSALPSPTAALPKGPAISEAAIPGSPSAYCYPSASFFYVTFTGNNEADVELQVRDNMGDCTYWTELYRGGRLLGEYGGGYSGRYLDSGLSKGQTYTYVLKAYGQDVNSGETWEATNEIATTTGQVSGGTGREMVWSGSWHLVGPTWVKKLTIKPGTTVYMDNFAYGQRLSSDCLDITGATLRNLDIEGDVVSIRRSTLDTVQISGALPVFEFNEGTCIDSLNDIVADDRAGFDSVQLTGNKLPSCTLGLNFRTYAGFGIPDQVVVENNQFKSLYLFGPSGEWGAAEITIENNQFAGSITTEHTSGPVSIVKNRVSGLTVRYVSNMTVQENVLYGPDAFNGMYLIGVSSSNIVGNHIHGLQSYGYAITVDDGSLGSTPVPSEDNTIRDNVAPEGYILIRASNNTIYNNAFRELSVQGSNPGPDNIWNVDKTPGTNIVGGPFLGGNWWDDYDGVDADGDGIGDTPYVVDQDHVDNLPLVGTLGPDLLVNPFQLSPVDVTFDGDNRRYLLPVDVLVENVGRAAADATIVRFGDNGGWSEDRAIPALQPGVSTTLHLDWDITPILLKGEGLYPVRLTATADPDGTIISDTIRSNNVGESYTWIDAKPKAEVKPEYILYESYYLNNTSLPNRIRVEVDWNGDLPDLDAPPYGDVHFVLNDQETVVNGQDWGTEHTYDMGQDFQSSFSCANNTLRIWVGCPVQGGEFRAEAELVQPTVFPFPAWVEWVIVHIPGSDAEFTTEPKAPLVKYSYNFKYPEPPFEATWTPPDWVPYIGGEELGIQETQSQVNTTGKSDGSGFARVEGQTGFALAALTAEGALWGQGDVQFKCGESLALERAELGFRINVTVEKEMGLVELIPAVKAAENWPVVGRVIRWVLDVAKVKGSLSPKVEIVTEFKEEDDQLKFARGQGTGSIDAQVTLSLDPVKGLSAKVRGGGRPYVTIQVPGDPRYLKEVGIDLYFWVGFQFKSFEADYDRKVNCHYPGECRQIAEAGQMAGQPTWHLISRDYAGPGYATFVGDDSAAFQSTATTAETVLIANVYPYPEPALAVRADGRRLLTHVHDDTAKPQGRGTEIAVLTYDGDSWSPPFSLTDDLQPDFGPAVAFDGSDHGLVLWERSALTVGITPTLDITYAQSLEIAYAVYTVTSGAWSSSGILGEWGMMNRAPRLSVGADGTVMALWEIGDGYDVMGTAGHPISYTYALWDGTGWSTPTVALGGLQDVIDVAFAAYSATEAALVYVVDADGIVSTTADVDLYYSTFDGAAWSAPAVIADGSSLTDIAPALAYDAAGDLHLLWLRGGELVWLKDSWDLAGLRLVRSNSTEAGFLSFSLSRDPNGNLALIWQAMGEDGADLTYSVYDLAADLWGADQTLMSDADLEAAHSPVFADGTLYAAYQRIETEFVTQTFEISPGVYFTVTHLPQLGESDLIFLDHTVGWDLTFDHIAVTPANPAMGQAITLTAILRNAGDLAVVAPQVSFYGGVTQIATPTLPITLAAGYTATVQVEWTLPATATVHTLGAVADPDGLVAETDETNNEITLTTMLPDLYVDLLYTSHRAGELTLTARLANAGVLNVVTPFTVAFRLEDPLTGMLVATATVESNIVVGGRLTLTHVLTDVAGLAGLGDTLWAVADAGDAVAEADEGNNAGYAFFGVLPDLTLRMADFTVTVRNEGVLTATGVVLAVWQDGLSGTLVYSGTVGELGPGAGQVVSLPAVEGDLWAKADPNDAIAEMDESNNLAMRRMGAVTFRVHLPLVFK